MKVKREQSVAARHGSSLTRSPRQPARGVRPAAITWADATAPRCRVRPSEPAQPPVQPPGRTPVQSPVQAEPVRPETGAELLRRVAQEQSTGRIPALTAAVMRDGALAWSGGRGRVGGARPNADTQSRIGSISKTFTAVLVARLRDEGRLDLADPLDRHVPGTPFGDRTIAQLLAHVSGLQAERNGALVGAHARTGMDPGWRRRSTARRPARGRPPLPLLQPRLRRARRGGGPQRWLLVVRGAAHRGAGAAGSFAVRRTGRSRRTPPVRRPPVGRRRAARARRRRRRDGPGRAAVVDGRGPGPIGGVRGRGHRRRARPGHAGGDARAARGRAGDRLDLGYGLGWQVLRVGGRTLVGHGGSMPGFLAGLYVDVEQNLGGVCLANTTSGLRPSAWCRT